MAKDKKEGAKLSDVITSAPGNVTPAQIRQDATDEWVHAMACAKEHLEAAEELNYGSGGRMAEATMARGYVEYAAQLALMYGLKQPL